MAIKIGFCGSHATGKTTLARRLHEDIPNSYFVSEVARNYAPEDLKECKTQQKILADQIREEVYASMQADVVITDRTVVDNAAYLSNVCGLKSGYKVLAFLHQWIDAYDVIFFCPIEDIPLTDDGFRLTNNTERDLIELIIKRYIEILQRRHKHSVRFWCLSGDEGERYEKVREVVGGLCGI
ncbi:MAG: AAA family ATPase [Methanosarcinales archaeon]